MTEEEIAKLRAHHEDVLLDQKEAALARHKEIASHSRRMMKWAVVQLDKYMELFDELATLDGVDGEDPKLVAWAMETMSSLLELHTPDMPLGNLEKFDPDHLEDCSIALDNVLCNVLNSLLSVADHNRFMVALFELIPPGFVVHEAIRDIRRRNDDDE